MNIRVNLLRVYLPRIGVTKDRWYEWPLPDDPEDFGHPVEYHRTTPSFARAHPDECVWLQAMCLQCVGRSKMTGRLIAPDHCFAHGDEMEPCEECLAQSVPYRKN
ncbi:hypothetical protein [Candidatus Poriferisocius sp.]|uniref:hypothetical protein n=1 Tax=Candidatus Poriferisocius sp. TaxID=3101276 RepID=UPI003B026B99